MNLDDFETTLFASIGKTLGLVVCVMLVALAGFVTLWATKAIVQLLAWLLS